MMPCLSTRLQQNVARRCQDVKHLQPHSAPLPPCRIFRLNGKLATRAAVRKELLKQHVFGEFSFVRQAQVAELVQSSSSAALAGIISGAFSSCLTPQQLPVAVVQTAQQG
jgi:hypothetical protein